MLFRSPVLRGLAAAACLALLWPLAAQAQNIAIVNGKPVPKSRVDALMQQVARSGQQLPPGAEQRVKDETFLREIFAQEAEAKGLAKSAEVSRQLEQMREDYRDLDSEPGESEVHGRRLEGLDINFSCLDFTNTTQVRTLETPDAVYLLVCQAEDHDWERIAEIFAAMTASFVASLPAAPE